MSADELRTEENILEVDSALCRATLYSALALGFRPPTEETIARLTSERSLTVLEAAAKLIDRGCHSDLATRMKDLFMGKVPNLAVLLESYWKLFGHTARGAVSPYETEYGSEALFQQPQELGDLMGFYRAFGLAPVKTIHERPDHISCECEYLSFLALKETYALEHADFPMLEEIRKAARLFLRDHLGRFVPAFAKNLTREDRIGIYANLGSFALRFVAHECSRVHISLGPDNLNLRPPGDDRVPLACGGGEECPAMPGREPFGQMEKP